MTERQKQSMIYIISLMEREARITKRANLKIENVVHIEDTRIIPIINSKKTVRATIALTHYERDIIGMSLHINGSSIWNDAITAGDLTSIDYERVICGLIMTIIYQEVKRDEEMLQKSDI